MHQNICQHIEKRVNHDISCEVVYKGEVIPHDSMRILNRHIKPKSLVIMKWLGSFHCRDKNQVNLEVVVTNAH